MSTPAAFAEINRFAAFYRAELSRTGFKPDATSTRDTRVKFLQETVKRFCSPLLSMKRGSPTRPISDEVVVYVRTREFRDFLRNGGTSNYEVLLSDETELLPMDQPLVNPLDLTTLTEPITTVPTVPGCSSVPVPEPEPEPTPIPPGIPTYESLGGDQFFRDHVGVPLATDMREVGQHLNDGSSVWFSRTAYDCIQARFQDPTVDIVPIALHHRNEWRAILNLPPIEVK